MLAALTTLKMFILAHQLGIGEGLAAWILFASIANRTFFPQPASTAPKWLRVLHEIFVDAPAFVASKEMNGVVTIPWLKIPITIPFLSGSMAPTPSLGVPADMVKKEGGFTRVGVLVFLCGLALLAVFLALPSGCTKNGCTAAEAIGLDCGVPALEKAALDLLPAIEARISSSPIDWAAIGNAELQDGLPQVACAVQLAEKAAVASVPSPADMAGVMTALDPTMMKIESGLMEHIAAHAPAIRANAKVYYGSRRVTFKEAKAAK